MTDDNGLQSAYARRTLLGPPPARERADAARNRQRILAAARSVFARDGFHSSTMDRIAEEAGVGKGTLYRRFTDKAGLAAALLDDRGVELQRAVMSGQPPLGPGAPAAERLEAFVGEYLRFQVENLDLVVLSEASTDGGRLRGPVYAFWRHHCLVLLAEAGAPDPAVRAELLLAACAAQQVRDWVRVRDEPVGALVSALGRAVRDLAAGAR